MSTHTFYDALTPRTFLQTRAGRIVGKMGMLAKPVADAKPLQPEKPLVVSVCVFCHSETKAVRARKYCTDYCRMTYWRQRIVTDAREAARKRDAASNFAIAKRAANRGKP